MKWILLAISSFTILSCVVNVEKQNNVVEKEGTTILYVPEKDLGDLFVTIQMAGIYEDSKTFVDANPKMDPDEIITNYINQSKQENFDLKSFVENHFDIPSGEKNNKKVDNNPDLEKHLVAHWDYLTREPDEIKPYSSLIPLPSPYIVPGGRFREIYYWDSYFTIIGLAATNKWELVNGMTDNFAHLIDEVGFIPNGNRAYYLTRSQPPFFSSIVALQMKNKGEEKGLKYLSQLEKEYQFWMNGAESLTIENNSIQHTVLMKDGEILNRYWDKSDQPRPESYREDVLLAEKVADKKSLYRNLRSAAESGWDFSTRWFADVEKFESIETTKIIPVDLNCLLFHLESTLGNLYDLSGDETTANQYKTAAENRKNAILKYCWNEEKKYFADYNFVRGIVSDQLTLAASFPLYYGISNAEQAKLQAQSVVAKLLKPQGLLSTEITSGQQWDAPNGWAPLQWVTIKGFEKYGIQDVAEDIKKRWMKVNEKIYKNTGKMMEKYNVADSTLVAGGGEYPTQDGFGWTNGVYLGLKTDFSNY